MQHVVKSVHEHVLSYVDTKNDGTDGNWCCNGTEIFETGCKSGLDDDSCEENNQMGQAVILSDLVMFMIFDDYLTLRQVVLILIALCRFLFRKMSIGKFNLHVSLSLGSFVSDKNI